MTQSIYQIQIALRGFKPKIWRRLLIPSDMLLFDFHKVIQTSMGWNNSHLHHFFKNGHFYSIKIKDDFLWDDRDTIDYKRKKIRVSDLLMKEKESMIYEYDFGDSWEHDIILEKILPADSAIGYPICVKGKMRCPPEDCGGVWGYADMLEILDQPDHDEYEDIIEWLEEGFDPMHFNKDEVNSLLKSKNYGCY